jgi:hypothetical protein
MIISDYFCSIKKALRHQAGQGGVLLFYLSVNHAKSYQRPFPAESLSLSSKRL